MGILKEKTVLFVTHQVEFLPAADLILVCYKLDNVSCMVVVNGWNDLISR